MRKANYIVIVIFSFFMCSMGFSQQNRENEKSKFDGFYQKSHSLLKKSGPEMSVQSAVIPYTFSYSMGTYTNLENPTSLNGGLTWDEPNFIIPMPFNFVMDTDTVVSLYVRDLGGMLIPGINGIQPFIYYAVDLKDRGADTINGSNMPNSLSPVSYQVTGTTGSQILKVEWRNAGFFKDIEADNVSVDSVNFQMWLYEGTNDMEIHFGPSYVSQPILDYLGYSGPVIGVGSQDFTLLTRDFLCLQGNPASPTDTTTDVNGWVALSGTPVDGIIYKFSWVNPDPNAGVFESMAKNNSLDIYPNPSNGIFNLKVSLPIAIGIENLKINDIEIDNVLGERIYSASNSQINQFSNSQIDLSSQSKGIYFIKAIDNTNTAVAVKKIVIQ